MRKNYLKALVFVAGLLGYSTNSNAQYCTFTGTNSSYFINNFSTTGGVTNITNNASGFTTGGYNDATAMSVGQFAGASVNFSASFGGVGNTYGFNIWVDWNNNQVFDAAEKMYGSGAYVSTASGTITVPLGTAVGTYRMRTLANYLSTNPTACGSASGEAEDYTFTVTTPPTCMPVSALTLASASSTTANITWTAGGTETSWNIQWGAPGFTPGTGTEIGAATNPSTAYQITGLTANTNYDIYVQADCSGGDLATWKGPLSIYTGYCVFTGTSATKFINNFSTTGGTTNISNLASGFSVGGYNNATAMSVSQYATASVNFSAAVTGGSAGFNIWVDWNNNQVFDASEKVYASGAYIVTTTGSITVPAATPLGNYRMRIVSNTSITNPVACGTSANGEAEDYTFTVIAPPTCMPVSAITLASATFTTADITWTAGGTEASWNIQWGAPGFTPGTGTEIGAATSPSTAYSITGLTANTNYDVYVQADCSGGDLATWKGPFSVFTGYCTVSTTYTGDYLSSVSTTAASTNVSYTATSQPAGSYSNQTAQLFESYPGQTFDVNTTYVGGGNGVNVWIDFNQNLLFEASELIASQASSSASKILSITIPVGTALGDYRVRVRGQYGASANPPACGSVSYGSTIDFKLTIATPPACVAISALTLASVASTTANISWTAGGSETSWNIEWGVPGYAPGTGAEIGAASFPSTAYQITGLTADTHYDVYVQADCGGGSLATWFGPLDIFTGYCVVTSTNTLYGVKNFTTTNGILNINNTTGPGTYNNYSNMVVANFIGGTNVGFSITPVGTSNAGMGIWVDWNNNLIFDASEQVYNSGGYVYTGSGTIAIPVGTLNGNYRMRVVVNYLTGTPTPCGDLGSVSYGEAEDYTFKVITQPSCMPISNLTTNNIYTDSISLTWTAGGIEASWNVQWGLPGFAPGTGAEIGAGSTPTTTYMINGLNPSTNYDIYVQANCGSDSSFWALVTGTTLCAPISTLPWTENFDAMTTIGNNIFPNCWVDESGDWSSNNSINGQPYTAPNYVSMGSYGDDYLWTPEFNLTAGSTYEFAFRWIGNGSSQYVGGAYYSPSQSSIDAVQMGTNFINTTDLSSSTDYKKEIYCFTPTTSGVYSFGIHVTSGYSPKVLSFDNFSVRIPSPNAGTNGATTVCQTGGLVDLNSVITISDTTGVWAFSPNPSAITSDSLFNPAYIPSGTTNVYYIVGGCIPDSAMATINIYPKSNAGTDGTISTCNYGPFNLFDGLTGSVDLGGQWYNPASQPIPGSIVNFNGQIAANYNYIYVVSNGVCPNDTSVIEIQLQDCAGVNEYELKGFVLYPNPSNGIINIQYSGKGEDVKLDVIDSKGAIVWSKQIQFNDGTKQTIDLSTVENGIYYINMTAKDGGSVMKVVKN